MSRPVGSDPAEPTRVLRVISRLNVGGPAIQAISLTKLLEPRGYRTTLVRGREDPHEGSMDDLADRLGVQPVPVPWIRRDVGWRDAPALLALARVLHRERPHLVHSHAAKGGTLGRVAALLTFPRRRSRPALVHTFHGHSLSRYFSSRRDRLHLAIERSLARRTDRLVAVSQEVRDELVGMGVAPAGKFAVIPVGFDLCPFTVDGPERTRRRAAVRDELGLPPQARVVTLVARLVPIKRVDRFLRIVRRLDDLSDAAFVIVGDGDLRDRLRQSSDARALDGRLVWTGLRRDMPDVCFASDIVVLTSDNEGTPVSLIEAQAAGVPVVATRVGGAASVMEDGETGWLVAPDDEDGFADAVRRLARDPELAGRMGAAGRQRSDRFALDRLVDDVDRLYRGVLRNKPS